MNNTILKFTFQKIKFLIKLFWANYHISCSVSHILYITYELLFVNENTFTQSTGSQEIFPSAADIDGQGFPSEKDRDHRARMKASAFNVQEFQNDYVVAIHELPLHC